MTLAVRLFGARLVGPSLASLGTLAVATVMLGTTAGRWDVTLLLTVVLGLTAHHVVEVDRTTSHQYLRTLPVRRARERMLLPDLAALVVVLCGLVATALELTPVPNVLVEELGRRTPLSIEPRPERTGGLYLPLVGAPLCAFWAAVAAASLVRGTGPWARHGLQALATVGFVAIALGVVAAQDSFHPAADPLLVNGVGVAALALAAALRGVVRRARRGVEVEPPSTEVDA